MDQFWRFGWPNGNDAGYGTLSELNSHFGSGPYLFQVSGTSIALNLTGDLYPSATPLLTLSGGNWLGGVYAFNVNEVLTITTSVFAEYGSHIDDVIEMRVNNIVVEQSFASVLHGNNSITYVISANTFSAGQTASIGVDFLSVVDKQSNPLLPFSQNYALYDKYTSLTVIAVSEPAALQLLLFGGIAILGVLRLRRRADA